MARRWLLALLAIACVILLGLFGRDRFAPRNRGTRRIEHELDEKTSAQRKAVREQDAQRDAGAATEAPQELRVVVRSRSGALRPGAEVEVTPDKGEYWRATATPLARGTTGPDGSWLFRPEKKTSYWLFAYAGNESSPPVRVRRSTEARRVETLTLRRSRDIEATVTDDSKKLERVYFEASYAEQLEFKQVCGTVWDGRFALRGVPESALGVRLALWYPDRKQVTWVPLATTPSRLNLSFKRCRIRARCIGQNNAPVAGASLAAGQGLLGKSDESGYVDVQATLLRPETLEFLAYEYAVTLAPIAQADWEQLPSRGGILDLGTVSLHPGLELKVTVRGQGPHDYSKYWVYVSVPATGYQVAGKRCGSDGIAMITRGLGPYEHSIEVVRYPDADRPIFGGHGTLVGTARVNPAERESIEIPIE